MKKGDRHMARTSRTLSKNYWALFLLILLGIVVGSFIAYYTRKIEFLKWLNYGLAFAVGEAKDGGVVTLNLLDVIVISFGLKFKITIGSVIGAIVSVFIYKKL